MPDIVTPQTMWQVAQEILEEVDVSKDGLLLRFEDIGYPTGSKFTTVSAMKKKNRMCNRYSNILPWDHNGVKIHSSEAEGRRGRYINASLLKSNEDDQPPWAYIATQGPMKDTVNDFWMMVTEKQCAVIVMLTRCREGVASKCSEYFPESTGAILEEDGLHVTCNSYKVLEGGTIEHRDLTVQINGSQPFNCSHYQLCCWPDHGAPKETSTIRDLVEAFNSELSIKQGLPCVHCSAGVGRTGTFIVINIIMNRLHRLAAQNCTDTQQIRAALDVNSLIYFLRTQRMALVQGTEQLRFIFVALKDFIRLELKGTSSRRQNGSLQDP